MNISQHSTSRPLTVVIFNLCIAQILQSRYFPRNGETSSSCGCLAIHVEPAVARLGYAGGQLSRMRGANSNEVYSLTAHSTPGWLASARQRSSPHSPPPQVPLMRPPGGDESAVQCVNCGWSQAGGAPPRPAVNGITNSIPSTDHADDTDDELEPAPLPLRQRLQSAAAVPLSSTQRAQPGNEAEDPSQAVAEKLLEGWAMLAEHCPRCTVTPLVRSREGRIWCAKCKLFAVREGDAAGAAAPAPSAPAVPPAGEADEAVAQVHDDDARNKVFKSGGEAALQRAEAAVAERLDQVSWAASLHMIYTGHGFSH
jgi:uncharacterized Zn finger protein (UPF0148 family)